MRRPPSPAIAGPSPLTRYPWPARPLAAVHGLGGLAGPRQPVVLLQAGPVGGRVIRHDLLGHSPHHALLPAHRPGKPVAGDAAQLRAGQRMLHSRAQGVVHVLLARHGQIERSHVVVGGLARGWRLPPSAGGAGGGGAAVPIVCPASGGPPDTPLPSASWGDDSRAEAHGGAAWSALLAGPLPAPLGLQHCHKQGGGVQGACGPWQY